MRDLAELLLKARERYERMTPDERLHHDHAQRVSGAAGNVALSWSPTMVHDGVVREALDLATDLVERAAGPCPCWPCRNLAKWRGLAYCRDADGVVRRNDVASGVLFYGSIPRDRETC